MDFDTKMSLTILVVLVLSLCVVSYYLFMQRAALRIKLESAQRSVSVHALHAKTRARVQAITDYHHMANVYDETRCITMLERHVKNSGVKVLAITATTDKAFLPDGYVRMHISYLIDGDVDICNLDINKRQLQAWAEAKYALYYS